MRNHLFKSILLQFFLLITLQTQAYNFNRAPLKEVKFAPLPLGSIKAKGWLLKQLELQRDGLTGHSEDLYNSNNDLGSGSDWLGGNGDSWERVPYYVKGLTALAYTLDDQGLKDKLMKWIDWTLDHQSTNGFFGPPKNTDWWPRMPMLYALKDFYEATGDSRVISFMSRYFQYQYFNLPSATLNEWGKARGGDNIELVLWLYNQTGSNILLNLADRLKAQTYPWTQILSQNLFNAYGTDFMPKHNVNVPQGMKMPAIYFQRSKSAADSLAWQMGHTHLMEEHGQACGMQSGNEMIGGRSAMTGLELCSIVEQMQSCETAQMILGDARIGDQLEMLAYNALPGSLSKDLKGLQYYAQANQLTSQFGNLHFGQQYDNGLMPGPYSGYGCCRFNFHMGWPYFAKTLWAASPENGLAALAYAPCEVNALVGEKDSVHLTEKTNYPFGESIEIEIGLVSALEFPLSFRIPGWCKQATMQVNGENEAECQSGTFYKIKRKWENGDRIVLNFPMEVELKEQANHSVNVCRGPLVYSLKMDEKWTARTEYGNGFNEWEVKPGNNWTYALWLDTTHIKEAFQLVESAMPENPFVQSSTPVRLFTSARVLNNWYRTLNDLAACDPPVYPLSTDKNIAQIELVPYGAENIRISDFPLLNINNQGTTPPETVREDFSNPHQKGWINYNGSFMISQGQLLAANTVGYLGSKSVLTDTQFSDLLLEVDIKVSAQGDGGVIFRASRFGMGPDDYLGYYAGINAERQSVVLGKANGQWTQLATAPLAITADQWAHLKVTAQGSQIRIYVNDMNNALIQFEDASYSLGSVGVRCYSSITRWDNLKADQLSTGIEQPAADRLKFSYDSAQHLLSIELPDFAASMSGNASAFRSDSKKLEIIDINGKILYTQVLVRNLAVISTVKFSPGIYLFRIQSGSKSYQAKYQICTPD